MCYQSPNFELAALSNFYCFHSQTFWRGLCEVFDDASGLLLVWVLFWLFSVLAVFDLLFCAYSLKYESKIFLSNGCIFYPMFELALKTMLTRVSECEFFSLNCSKFALECNWSSKKSQNVQNLGFFAVFWKNRWVFSKKSLKIFKIAKSGKFFLECVSNGIIA